MGQVGWRERQRERDENKHSPECDAQIQQSAAPSYVFASPDVSAGCTQQQQQIVDRRCHGFCP